MSIQELRNAKFLSDSTWLEKAISSTIINKTDLPFAFLSKQISNLKKDYILSPELLKEMRNYKHLIAIYMSKHIYKKERLLYYHTIQAYRNVRNADSACKMLCKLKLLSSPELLDMEAEQALSLTLGVIGRLQSNRYYEVKSIDERLFFDLHVKFGRYLGRELVHIVLLRPFIKKAT